MRFTCIRTEHRRPARVGEDRHAVARRQGLVAQHLGGIEKLFESLGADDARLLEEGTLA
jgi:hypothetical protein